MRVPTRSAGTRSGVNWIRRNEPPRTSASVRTVSVFASPGTPSSSTWPPASSATSSRSSIASWPTITRLISYSAPSRARRAGSASERIGKASRAASVMAASLARRSSAPDKAPNVHARLSRPFKPLHARAPRWTPMRVLIAEDQPRVGDAVARGLRREGMAVDLARDGATALRKALTTRYDVVVLDRDLPELHGDDVCRTLAAERPDTKVLMLTAAAGVDDLVGGPAR